MGNEKYKLGELIEQTFVTNSNLEFGVSNVRGMTIAKQIIPTKANMKNTELSKFIIVRPYDFIYNPRTHGKKIGLGYNDTDESFIISWNNIAFHIKPKEKIIILPDYLFLHFNRAEWDREACYRSWGSSTEVFSWDDMCDMEIELPPISVQKKFVDVYNAILQNQKIQEKGLTDLKLTCDVYIENLRQKATVVSIGDYIKESDERNTALQYSVDAVKGITTQKQFIETKADMEGVKLNTYKIVYPKQFAYVPDTSRRGDKISLAYNDSERTCLVSSISTVFSVNGILPEYLFLFFRRDDFNRYTRFHSWGSVREVFTFDDMCNVKIPIPDINVQQAIVNIFIAYGKRKAILERLKIQMAKLCPVLVKGALGEMADMSQRRNN